ncbi:MAG: hypothetical protein K1562_08430 [Candidatus Thiodiazotropha sp. (ex. Lucinisca nassula)]|nr:hypothetical protein [Candidatus Thiodiazotropha sp. (ex. Lucinisca nassula)]
MMDVGYFGAQARTSLLTVRTKMSRLNEIMQDCAQGWGVIFRPAWANTPPQITQALSDTRSIDPA